MTLAEAIKQMAKDPSAEIYSSIGEVSNIDETKRTCDVKIVHSDLTIFDCRFQSEVDKDKGIFVVPKDGSFVVISWLSNNHAFVSACTEIEQIVVDIPKVIGKIEEIEIKDTKIKINDGSNGGIPKVVELTNKINALENQLNNILTALKSISIPLAPAGTVPFAPFFAAINPIAPLTQSSDIENSDIKH